ncbi:MAG: hypothetical protein ACYCTY_13040 [Sulfuricella sp.]
MMDDINKQALDFVEQFDKEINALVNFFNKKRIRTERADIKHEAIVQYLENIKDFDPCKGDIATFLLGKTCWAWRGKNRDRLYRPAGGEGGDEEPPALDLAAHAQQAGKRTGCVRGPDNKFHVEPRRRLNAAALGYLGFWERPTSGIAAELGIDVRAVNYKKTKAFNELRKYGGDFTGMGFEGDE